MMMMMMMIKLLSLRKGLVPGELKINFVIKAWLGRTFKSDINEEWNGDHENQIEKEFDEAKEKK